MNRQTVQDMHHACTPHHLHMPFWVGSNSLPLPAYPARHTAFLYHLPSPRSLLTCSLLVTPLPVCYCHHHLPSLPFLPATATIHTHTACTHLVYCCWTLPHYSQHTFYHTHVILFYYRATYTPATTGSLHATCRCYCDLPFWVTFCTLYPPVITCHCTQFSGPMFLWDDGLL